MCSIFKTVELKAITDTKDPTWDAVNLGIWSSAECSTGILIAALPPLRKAFDNLFKRIVPSTLQNSQSKPQYGYGYGHSTSGNIRMSTFQSSKAYHSRIPGESILDNDSDSDRAILQEEEGKCAGIMKTTKVTVEENEASGSQSSQLSRKRSHDWPEPRAGPGGHVI